MIGIHMLQIRGSAVDSVLQYYSQDGEKWISHTNASQMLGFLCVWKPSDIPTEFGDTG